MKNENVNEKVLQFPQIATDGKTLGNYMKDFPPETKLLNAIFFGQKDLEKNKSQIVDDLYNLSNDAIGFFESIGHMWAVSDSTGRDTQIFIVAIEAIWYLRNHLDTIVDDEDYWRIHQIVTEHFLRVIGVL